MVRGSIASILAGGALCLSAAAQAQEHPVFLPTRDVAVTYQLSGGGGGPSQTTHMYFSTAANKLRIDTPGNAGYTVLDRNAGQRVMVMNQEQSFATVPLDPGTETGFILNSSMNYHRVGTASVNGIGCITWTVSSPQATGLACVTADGVLLRGSGHQLNGGGDTSLVATSVDYTAQPATLFLPPSGFHQLDASQMQAPPGPGGNPQGGPANAGDPASGPGAGGQ